MEEIAERTNDVEEGVATVGRSLAAVGIVVFSVGLGVLPALIAFGIASRSVAQVAVGLGGLAVVTGGVKVAAVALGALRMAALADRRVSEASFD